MERVGNLFVCLFVRVFVFFEGGVFRAFCVKQKTNIFSMWGCVIVANQGSIKGYKYLEECRTTESDKSYVDWMLDAI